MKRFTRRLVLMFLAMLPIASIAFAAQKALKVGELKDDFEEESVGSISRGSGSN
jgi:hypothetical protein